MKILAIDPSGNWNKTDKGRTGFAVWDNGKIYTYTINGKDCFSQMDYWEKIIDYFKLIKPDFVICEDFMLYQHKALEQSWDRMETSRLLGILEWKVFWLCKHPIIFQSAAEVKQRWTNKILNHKNLILPYGMTKCWTLANENRKLCDHEIDALRHLMHGYSFNKSIQEDLKNGIKR